MKPYYDQDGITIYHGDCLQVDVWQTADVLVTDPPYGISWEAKKGDQYENPQFLLRRVNPIHGDGSTELRDEVLSLWGDRPAVVFGSWRMPRPEGTRHRLIWHKQGMNPGPLNAPFMSQDEEIYILGAGFVASSPPLRSVIVTSENRPLEVAKYGHPTVKPLGLMTTLLVRCPPGVIADPFMGSGSTLLAARQLGRQAIGVEIEERYCELAAERLAQGVLNFADQVGEPG